jgi:hypothetical protein
MSMAIKIMITDLPTSEVIHRLRNLGEDIFHLLRDVCSVNIEAIDSATDDFVVRDIHRCDLGLVTLMIIRELKSYHFDGSASLVRM